MFLACAQECLTQATRATVWPHKSQQRARPRLVRIILSPPDDGLPRCTRLQRLGPLDGTVMILVAHLQHVMDVVVRDLGVWRHLLEKLVKLRGARPVARRVWDIGARGCQQRKWPRVRA